ncbi:hypothetical protein RI367_005409 [Sorochytrium milnesiophthora]
MLILPAAIAVLLATLVQFATPAQLTVAVSLPTSSASDGPAANGIDKVLTVSLDSVNSYLSQNGGHSFVLNFLDSKSRQADAVQSVFDAVGANGNGSASNSGAFGLIGEYASSNTIPMALTANHFKLWQCSGAATSPTLSDKTSFPYFFRTIPPDNFQGIALAYFCKNMGWKRVSILAGSDAYGAGIADAFSLQAKELDITIATSQTFPVIQVDTSNSSLPLSQSADSSPYDIQVNAIKASGSRIVLFFGVQADFIAVARVARTSGIIASSDWVWVGSDGLSTLVDTLNGDPSFTQHDKDNANGVFYAFPSEQGPNFGNFKSTFAAKNPGAPIVPYAMFYADCLAAMARGLVAMLSSGVTLDQVNARSYNNFGLDKFLVPFDGLTGAVQYAKPSMERVGVYNINNIFKMATTAAYDISLTGAQRQHANPTFFSGTSDIPPAIPNSINNYPTWHSFGAWIMLGLAGILFVLIAGTNVYLYINRNHAAVRNMSLPFLTMISTGLCIILASTAMWIDVPTFFLCNASVWVFAIGFQMVLSAVAAKAYRIWKIFDNRTLTKLHLINNRSLFLGCAAIVFLQCAVLLTWTVAAPMYPNLKPSFDVISYECSSTNRTMQLTFSSILLAYNAALLLLVCFLAYKTRTAYSAFRESSFILYTAQNIFLSGLVASPLIYISSAEFALGAYYIRAVVTLYAVAFSYVCLVGRIAMVLIMHHRNGDGTGFKLDLNGYESGSSGGGGGGHGAFSQTQTNVGAGGAATTTTTGHHDGAANSALRSAEQLPGKPQTMQGRYPIKVSNKLFQTWRSHRLTLFALEGYLGMTHTTANTEQGKLFRLRSIQFDPEPAAHPLCIEIRADGTAYLVQFTSADDRMKWIRVLSVHCLVTSRSSANKTTLQQQQQQQHTGVIPGAGFALGQQRSIGNVNSIPLKPSAPSASPQLGSQQQQQQQQQQQAAPVARSTSMRNPGAANAQLDQYELQEQYLSSQQTRGGAGKPAPPNGW